MSRKLVALTMDPFNDDHSTLDEEQDPAAAFLAQEDSRLAGIDDDDFERVGVVENGYSANEDGMTSVRENGIDGHFANGDDFLDGDQQDSYGFGGDNQNNMNEQRNMYEAPKIRPMTPEKIRKWREEQKERLEKKDAEEEKKRQELRAQAQRELEDWYQTQEDSTKKMKKSNREAEKDFVNQRDSDKPGEEWDRVSRLCDFNPKSAKGTKDVSRLRSIILQLKQEKST